MKQLSIHLARMMLVLVVGIVVATVSIARADQGDQPVARFQANDASTFTVNTTDDTDDGCTSAHCTLREAIHAANSHAGRDTIVFNIDSGAQTIRLTSPLPVISDTVIIDGTSQPGFQDTPLIELDGSAVISTTHHSDQTGFQRTGMDGLVLTGGKSVVKGLMINRFRDNGIVVRSDQNTIQGNFIGVASDGRTRRGNVRSGLLIQNAAHNTIGGTQASDGNLISGNLGPGIEIMGSNARENRIQGNVIGSDHEGTLALGNGGGGVFITDASANSIGGTTSGAGNLISGNRANGVEISGQSALENRVEGNLIGTDSSGRFELGNTNAGVMIADARRTVVGGTRSGAGNIISANGSNGVEIAGSDAIENAVKGNIIGTDATQTQEMGNGGSGVLVNSAPGNVIGGITAQEQNSILYNSLHGVAIQSSDRPANQVLGNMIVQNERSGIFVVRSRVQVSNNTVREHFTGLHVQGTDVNAAGNTIDGNTTAIDLVAGILRAYANNITNSAISMRYLGGDFSGKYNWWGRESGTRPEGLEFETWEARLMAPVAAWNEGVGGAVLDRASIEGGVGTAVVVRLESEPFIAVHSADDSLHSKLVCSDFYNFFVIDGSGTWDVTIPLDERDACQSVLEDTRLFQMGSTRCSTVASVECWSALSSEQVITREQSLVVAGLSIPELESTILAGGDLEVSEAEANTETDAEIDAVITATTTLDVADADATPTAAEPATATPTRSPDTSEPAATEPLPRWRLEGWPNAWVPVEFRYILAAIGAVGLVNVVMAVVIIRSMNFSAIRKPAQEGRQDAEPHAEHAPVKEGGQDAEPHADSDDESST